MSLWRTASLFLLLTPLCAYDNEPLRETLVTHEWGTLTSVAAADGRAVKWAALVGPADLPCFVNRISEWSPKLYIPGLVRMETPVLYFYSHQPLTVSVGVKFPQGWITEWYPSATSVKPTTTRRSLPNGIPADTRTPRYGNGEIRWNDIQIQPGEDPAYPTGRGKSPYYTARRTDSSPLRIGNQQEKLIFYRGIGDFEVPLQPSFTNNDAALKIVNTGSETVPLAILFENRGGAIGYRMIRGLRDTVETAIPEPSAKIEDLHRELATQLVEFGLYRKEALAMIETWKDSWFEPGTRLLYIVPREQVDAFLPLEIQPAPTTVARVFVGRIEILSPWTRGQIETAASRNDTATLKGFGRFLDPFVSQIARTKSLPMDSIQKAREAIFEGQVSRPHCVQ